MIRLAVIGESGQLARALKTSVKTREIDARFYGRDALDLTADAQAITDLIDGLDVDALIIAAAYTAVDAAETDIETARKVNTDAPIIIAKACAKHNIALVHISTDYVFDGMGAHGPYSVDAPTAPINVYGHSKRGGEIGITALIGSDDLRAAVLRTSWVFDGTGKNFVTTMLRLGQTRDALSVVGDQVGRPTFAGHLADAALDILPHVMAGKASGIYHVTGAGDPVSWADFARAIFAMADLTVAISDIPTSDYPTPAARPAFSVLDLSRFTGEITALPNWRTGLKQAYNDWCQAQT